MPPAYSVLLQPHCDEEGICGLSVNVTFEAPNVTKSDTMCTFMTENDIVPSHRYTDSNVTAQDAAGPLALHMSAPDAQSCSRWTVDRDTVGNVTLSLDVLPRHVDEKTPVGPRWDLRRDQGGLLGSAGWFLPVWDKYERYTFSVAWDLSLTPPSTRASWSYGDGTNPETVDGPMALLTNSLFMVGDIQSWPGRDEPPATCTVYWFGEIPSQFEILKSFNDKIFPYACKVFDDDADRYGIYVRKSLRGCGGTNFSTSLMLEYSEGDQPQTEAYVISLATHEMTHNWLYLGNEDDGYMNSWYIEGKKLPRWHEEM